MGAVLPGLDPLHCAVLDIMPCRAEWGAERLTLVGQVVGGQGCSCSRRHRNEKPEKRAYLKPCLPAAASDFGIEAGYCVRTAHKSQ